MNRFNLKGKNAEQLVYGLALKTFLTDWCYRNPRLPNGKELCDLLVVYDDVAIIWQIKSLRLDNSGRYRSSEVAKNLRQLLGARRQLAALQVPVELENPRRGKEVLRAEDIREIHLISVLEGEGEAYYSFMERIKDHEVHVFTDDFTQLALNELDTVKDFIGYLRAEESIVRGNKQIIVSGGEQELLAFYLANGKSFDTLKNATNVFIDQGFWEKFSNSREYREKKRQDKTSYGWDSIIDRIHESSAQYELIAREMARPDRFERRVLAKAFYDAYVSADMDSKYDLFRRTLSLKGVTYCFLFANNARPKAYRRVMLEAMCYVARGTLKSNRKVIGIATEKKSSPECSYDFCLLDMPVWTDRDEKEMERIKRETGILVSPQVGMTHEEEYPKRAED